MSNDDDSFGKEEEQVIEGESELLRDMGKGLAAGFIGMIPVAILLLLKNMLGVVPDADLIGVLGAMLGGTWAGAGWVVLFAGGTLLGIGFAALDAHVEHATGAGEIARGAIFGFLLSFVLMILIFGLNNGALGVNLAAVIFVVDIIYGMVMGAVYEMMSPEIVAT